VSKARGSNPAGARRPHDVDLAALLRHLERRRGAAAAVRARDLAVLLGIRDSGTSVRVRAAVRELVARGHPIGSLTDAAGGAVGFFVVSDERELERVLANLRSRARQLERRMADLINAFRHGPKQPGLFAGGGP